MMNQTNHFIQPFETRSSVTAKDVLLQTVAKMEKNPAEYEKSDTFSLSCISS